VVRVSGSEGTFQPLLLTTQMPMKTDWSYKIKRGGGYGYTVSLELLLAICVLISHIFMNSMRKLLIVFKRMSVWHLRLPQLATQLWLMSETWSTPLDPVLEVGESVKDYAVLDDKQSHKKWLTLYWCQLRLGVWHSFPCG
jgi:hypothetical protein